jgi:hypothetical protein
MRLWSLHPKYLDSRGLIAVWREGLLAKKVLEGKTKGYKNHPQLDRFKSYHEPLKAINTYLFYIMTEAGSRGYVFDKSKIRNYHLKKEISVTRGQLTYEFEHLSRKLQKRDVKKFEEISCAKIIPNPLFKAVPGNIAKWEKVSDKRI